MPPVLIISAALPLAALQQAEIKQMMFSLLMGDKRGGKTSPTLSSYLANVLRNKGQENLVCSTFSTLLIPQLLKSSKKFTHTHSYHPYEACV